METIRKHTKGQWDAFGAFLLALLCVLAYSIWGAYMLHQEHIAQAAGTAVAVTR